MKEAQKAHNEANKIVKDKKSTLSSLTLEVSQEIRGHEWIVAMEDKMRQEGCKVKHFVEADEDLGYPYVIRWRRKVDKEYSEEEREWKVVEPHKKLEPILAIFMAVSVILRNSDIAEAGVLAVKRRLPAGWRLFIFLAGRLHERDRDEIMRFSVKISVSHGAHIMQPAHEDYFVQMIYDMSADLGIKEYK